jgi:hypothetical protein
MTVNSSDRLEERIRALSRSRDVLALLISKVDAELIPLKIQRNAQSPSHRIPDELLVRIFELVQLRDDADDGWISGETSLPKEGWWRVMSVCTRFRTVAVEAPELWTRFDQGWPERWRDVCLQRTKSWPLRISVRITDWSSAVDARNLLENSGHAKLVLTELPGDSVWNAENLYVSETSSPSLLSLMIESDGPRDEPTLTLAPPLFICYTRLSHLRICVRSEIDDSFEFPPTLKWLYIREFSISPNLHRLRRLFQGIPDLRHFEAVVGVGTTEAQLQLEPEISKIDMPSLECLRLKYCDMAFTHAMLRIIATPQRALNLSFNYERLDGAPVENSSYHAQITISADVLAFAQRFWAQRTGSTQLPPVTLSDFQSGTDPYTSCYVSIQGGEEDVPSSPTLAIDLGHYPFTIDNPLLPHVAKLELIGINMRRGPALDMEKWPALSRLSVLRTLLIICDGLVWKFIDGIQAWADRQTQQPILVEFSPGRQQYLPDDQDPPTLRWSSGDGPLKDAEWSAYIVAVRAGEPLPESHDGDSWDGNEGRAKYSELEDDREDEMEELEPGSESGAENEGS